MCKTKILKAKESDSTSIARLHKLGISEGFLSKQSDYFLGELYRYLIKNEILFIAKTDDTVVGFVAGTITTSGLYKKFLRTNKSLLLKFALKNMFSLEFIKKSFETLTAPSKTSLNSDVDLPELLSIVVDSSFAGKGTGQRLVQALDGEFKRLGIKKYKVLVGSQLQANSFYQKNGFIKNSEVELHKGDISNIYIKDL